VVEIAISTSISMPIELYVKIEDFAKRQTPPCKFSPAVQLLVVRGIAYSALLKYEQEHKDDKDKAKDLYVLLNKFKDIEIDGQTAIFD